MKDPDGPVKECSVSTSIYSRFSQGYDVALFIIVFYLFQIICEPEDKFLKLLELLGLYQEDGSVLVFVDKQEHADEVNIL